MQKHGEKERRGSSGDRAAEQRQRDLRQSSGRDASLLPQKSHAGGDQRAKQRRADSASAQDAAQVLPAMYALGQDREHAPRLPLHLQRRYRHHRGQEGRVACVPAQKEQHLFALRMQPVDSYDSHHVGGHNRKRDPLGADQIDADQEDDSHAV
jgi:hypothetical protein